MSKIQIMVIGRNEEILQTVNRLINNNPDWNCTPVRTDEEAIEKFHLHPFDIVLLTNGISDIEEIKLRTLFVHQDKNIIIIQHYGGGSGLLSAEIFGALDRRKALQQPTYSINDDVFGKKE